MRHTYKKDPERGGICTCGAGRAEDVHAMLAWHKANTGNYVSNVVSGAVWRCRVVAHGWVPSFGQAPDWTPLGDAMSLADAKAACERHRDAR